ncbi:MAG: LysM peptidoglycan-binding domain-containing protein [Deltaproteobacteria bacterium]|jgi:nucleoid-associated protein YgaU
MGPAPLSVLTLLVAQASAGEVVLPLEQWLEVEKEITRLEAYAPDVLPHAVRRRTLDVEFVRGVLFGTVTLDVDTHTKDAVLPLLDRAASLESVTIDGAPGVLVRGPSFYEGTIAKPGRHRVEVRFQAGREQARFERALALALPRAPVSRVNLVLPERDVDVDVERGVVDELRTDGKKTRARLHFTGGDGLRVRWRRRATHDVARAREMEAAALGLVRLEPELVHTQAVLTYTMVAGETDRVEAHIPDGVEVTAVEGPAILQWYTEERGAKRHLVVLLKHLVDDKVQIVVGAQAPLTSPTAAEVRFVTPADATLRDAWVAVEGRAGFHLEVSKMEGAEAVRPREVPEQLANLTDKPLLFAYRARTAWPSLGLVRTANHEIDLTQAVIDDLWVSTVLVEQGLEVTKMRLYVRNNTRQYLSMRLPEGAQVTHAMIDGAPFLPAVTREADDERLLVPLRQSERITGGQRRHRIRPGDTLGGLSLRYFGTSDRWDAIIDANPSVYGPEDLVVGEVVDIPNRAGDVTFEESNFVVELAYKVETGALTRAGARTTRLPTLDIPVMSATWHYYFPQAFEPLRFDSNLQQLSNIRYDPLRRLKQFFEHVEVIDHAWAGGGHLYENILESRKIIFQREQKTRVTEALAAFPLVGRRYRFERVLLEHEPAVVDVVYVERSLLPWLRFAFFALFVFVAFRLASHVRREGLVPALLSSVSLTFLAAAALAVFVGHYVLGVHRHAVLGADVGLALVVLPPLMSRWLTAARDAVRTRSLQVEAWWRPRRIVKIAVVATVLSVLLAYPLLLSTASLFGLVLLLVTAKEVR